MLLANCPDFSFLHVIGMDSLLPACSLPGNWTCWQVASKVATCIPALDTPHSVGLLWTSDQPVAETSTSKYTTLTRDRHLCPQWDLNPSISASKQPQAHELVSTATGIRLSGTQ